MSQMGRGKGTDRLRQCTWVGVRDTTQSGGEACRAEVNQRNPGMQKYPRCLKKQINEQGVLEAHSPYETRERKMYIGCW